jgi:hypothetical protein
MSPALTEQHREILRKIGERGAPAEKILGYGREFGELGAAGLVVFWSHRQPRPSSVYGGGVAPGYWYLTFAGAEALGLPPVLRLA